MSDLNEHFKQSGYTLHRAALRRECLPRCCRENMRALTIGINFMDRAGSEQLLPLVECAVCFKKYALSDGRYMAVKSLLKFKIAQL